MHDTSPSGLRRWLALLLFAVASVTASSASYTVRFYCHYTVTSGALYTAAYDSSGSGTNWSGWTSASLQSLGTTNYSDGTAMATYQLGPWTTIGGPFYRFRFQQMIVGAWTAETPFFFVDGSTQEVHVYGPANVNPYPWKLDYTITNRTNVPRNYSLDINGDGTVDTEFTLAPGQTHTVHGESDVAPGTGTLTSQYYLGDGIWSDTTLDTISPNAWTQSGQSGKDAYAHHWTPPVDSTSQTPQTQYGTASGGALTESTYKTGAESIRKAILEVGTQMAGGTTVNVTVDNSEVVAAINAHKSTTQSLFGDLMEWLSGLDTKLDQLFGDDDVEPKESAASASSQNARNSTSMDTHDAYSPTTTLLSPTAPTGTSADSWYIIPLGIGGAWGSVNWSPTTRLGSILPFVHALLTWGMWLLFGGWAFYQATGAVRQIAASPQGKTNSSTPVVSSGAGLAMAALVVAAIAVALGLVGTLLATSLAHLAGLDAWMAESIGGQVVALLSTCVPLSTAFGLSTAGFAFSLGLEAITLSSMAAIRAIAA